MVWKTGPKAKHQRALAQTKPWLQGQYATQRNQQHPWHEEANWDNKNRLGHERLKCIGNPENTVGAAAHFECFLGSQKG